MDADHARLNENGVFFVAARSEVRPGLVRAGLACNLVRIEADDAAGALAGVRSALGAKASECSEWHVRDAPETEEIIDPRT